MTRRSLCRLLATIPVLSLMLLGACDATTPSFAVIVRTISDDGKPMPGVPVKINATDGKTDAEGKWAVRLSGLEGSEIPISAEPPKGYRLPPKAPGQKGVVLRKIIGIDGKPLPLEYVIKLSPVERTYAILVKTGGFAGLPVETFGNRQVLTGEKGTASFLYRGAPGDELQVRISTADHPELRPINPTQTFILGQQSDAYVMQAKFAMPKPVAAPKKPSKPKPIGPKRL